MFISPAWAQAAGGAGGGFDIMSLMPIVLIFAVFYFLMIRPQQKKMKAHQAMLAALRRGDKIVTGGGLFGTVTKVVNDQEAVVEIAEGVRVRVARSTISSVLTKTEPAAAGAPKAANDSDQAPQSGGGGLLGKLMGKK
jgi:preprotein translocase subunit YajC